MVKRVSARKYFNGNIELKNVRWFSVDDDGRIIPKAFCQPGGKSIRAGLPVDIGPRGSFVDTGSQLDHRPVEDWLPLEREIKYLTKLNPHECDWRCQGAFPNGECWCACGGSNHGSKFKCEM